MATGTVSSINYDNWQLIQTNTTTSGTTSTFSDLSGYKEFMLAFKCTITNGTTRMNFNGDTTAGNYSSVRNYSSNNENVDTAIVLQGTNGDLYGSITITNVLSDAPKLTKGVMADSQGGILTGSYNATGAITSIVVTTSVGFLTGEIRLYGIAA